MTSDVPCWQTRHNNNTVERISRTSTACITSNLAASRARNDRSTPRWLQLHDATPAPLSESRCNRTSTHDALSLSTVVKAAFHDNDTDADILARIFVRNRACQCHGMRPLQSWRVAVRPFHAMHTVKFSVKLLTVDVPGAKFHIDQTFWEHTRPARTYSLSD